MPRRRRAKQYVTTGHTSGKCFGHFVKGSRMRMGMIRRQNEALTSALAMAVCAEAETRWHSPIGDNAREELEDTVVFMLAAFGAGLRGEEVPLISLDGLLFVLLFVWPPVGGGFLLLPPRLHGPKGQPPKFSRRENCWEVPKSHYAGVPCVLLQLRAYATYAFLRTC